MRPSPLLRLVLLPTLMAACAGVTPRVSSVSAPAGAPAGEAVQLETSTGILHGTLLIPPRRPPYPVALLVAGSGPTDRDGNSKLLLGANNSLKLLAEGLAARGIACLRYDK